MSYFLSFSELSLKSLQKFTRVLSMPSFWKCVDVVIPVVLVGAFLSAIALYEYPRQEDEVEDEDEVEENNKTNHGKTCTASPRRQFMLKELKPNPLRFTLIKDNVFVISYLFRTCMINNNEDDNKSQLLPAEISQLLSQFIGSNDCRVQFWNNYKDKYLITSNNNLDPHFNDGAYLTFNFLSPYSWNQALRLYMDGTYCYIFEFEVPMGFNFSKTQIKCDIMGIWAYDDQQQLIELFVIYKGDKNKMRKRFIE